MPNFILKNISISSLTGVGKVQSYKLAKIGLYTVQDLLFHFPLRYEDKTRFYRIIDLLPDMYATIKGKIVNCQFNFIENKSLSCAISDGSGILTIKFFNFNVSMKNIFTVGKDILVYGKVKYNKYKIEMIHPEFHLYKGLKTLKLYKTVTPIYATTTGLKQVTLLKLTSQALDLLDKSNIKELLPVELNQNVMNLPEALRILHRPTSVQLDKINVRKHPAQQRLILEELIAHQLNILKLRTGIPYFYNQSSSIYESLKNKLLASIPFKLTNAQMRAILDIEHDMTLNTPMMRLIQGDVGSGKTLVAAFAALRVIVYGKQVSIMVPTELLAEQHANNFSNWFKPLGIKVGWIGGKQKKQIRLMQKEAVANGKIQILIGTHVIFHKQIKFNNLALVIIDEQHRFGVMQRLLLWKKGFKAGENYPHQLIMTATPIPRTLSMTIYANLSISIIDELPPGRIPVVTILVSSIRRIDINNRVRHACVSEGRQVYWVCTVIEKSNVLGIQSVKDTYNSLKLTLPELNIGLMHGCMKSREKQHIMKLFKSGKLHLLVTTTLIEVGLDVPNASLMIIENPERLGLAQLHQLRGRIGRGSVISYCVLLYKLPLSDSAKKRLQVLRTSNNGFLIAQKDLEIRGSGEICGVRQTGRTQFKIVNHLKDYEIIPKVQYIAKYIHKNYPKKAAMIIERWIPKIKHYLNA